MDDLHKTQVTLTANPPTSTFTKFLELPLELREYVYEHYVVLGYEANRRGYIFDRSNLHVAKGIYTLNQPRAIARFLPNLASTSRAIRAEFVRVLLR
jgi:hypothetical protein